MVSFTDSYLRKSFVKVAQHEHVVSDWKYLSRELGVNEADILQIEEEFSSMRDRCFQVGLHILTYQDVHEPKRYRVGSGTFLNFIWKQLFKIVSIVDSKLF